MKAFLFKLNDMTERIKAKILKLIDRLAQKDIDKLNRQYELQYGKSINEDEMIEIKKQVIIRIWKYCSIVLIVLLVILSAM